MYKKQQFNGKASYVSPSMKSVNLGTRSHYLQTGSPYGLRGAAGRGFDSQNTNDYDDELL